MFNSRIFWKIYLNFISFVVLTGIIVGIYAIYEIHAGIAAAGIGAAFLLSFGFFLARRIALPLTADVSRRAAAASELKKSEQYQNLFRLAGVIGAGWQTVIHPEDLPAVVERWTASLETGADYEVEFRLKRADGVYRWHSGLAAAGRDADGNVIKWFGTNSDIDDKKSADKTRRESEEKFRSIIETTKDSIWAIDLDGNLTYNNPAIEAILGYTPEELCGKSFLPLMHEKDRAEFERLFPQFVREKRGWTNLVCRWRHKDDSIRYLESSAVPVFDDDGGELSGFRGTDHDITERKQSEDALRRSEANLTAAQRITRLGSWEVELSDTKRIKNNKVIWSDEVYRIFGCQPGQVDVSINHYFDAVHPSDRKQVRRAFLEAVSCGKDLNIEYRAVMPDGAERFQHGRGEVIYDRQSNQPVKFVGTVQDITDRKLSEEKLRESEAWLRAILDGSRDGIIIEDDGNIVYTNDAYARLLRYDGAEELIGTDISELLPPGEAERLSEYGRKRLRGEEAPSVYEFKGKRKDGTLVEVEGSISTTIIGGKKYIVTAVRDITERKRIREELQESEVRYRRLFESNPNPIWVYDAETLRFLAVNEESVRHYGYTREEFSKLNVADIRPPEDAPVFKKRIAQVNAGVERFYSVRHQKKDGTIIETDAAVQIINFAGRRAGFALITDVTERKKAERALQESEYKLRTLLGSMNEGLLQVDNDERIEFVNDCFCRMTGFAREELSGKTTFDIVYDDAGRNLVREANRQRSSGVAGQYELRLRKKNGEVLYAIVGGVPIIDAEGVVAGTMGVFTDITERKRAEEQLLHDAFHDGLTGLANRKLFMEHLQMTIERARRGGEHSYAVLFLDFDGFKVVNDSLGHAEGDRLLRQIAQRLEASLRPGDVVARLGGDEFTILLSSLVDEKDALQIAGRIQEDLKKPFDLGGREVFTSASIGIALGASGTNNQADEMLRDADIAMYRAKSNGKARYQVFDRQMHEHAIKRLRLETEMRQAIEREEFCAYYQPIVDIETNKLMGFESLIRWQHPERGMIPPFDFIPVAEENNLILPIGKWILRESCRQLRRWQTDYPAAADLTVSVNLSCKEFLQLDLAEQIAETLRETGLNPKCLKLEITESHVMENSETAVAMMNRLRALGVQLSLDDFGTGYSSLSYLHRLPVSYLKIDRSFVMRMSESAENEEIVRTIIRLAQNLKMQVIAEGIETFEQLAQLKQLKCEYGQGYFFSKPLEAEKAETLIDRSSENSTPMESQPIINLDANM